MNKFLHEWQSGNASGEWVEMENDWCGGWTGGEMILLSEFLTERSWMTDRKHTNDGGDDWIQRDDREGDCVWTDLQQKEVEGMVLGLILLKWTEQSEFPNIPSCVPNALLLVCGQWWLHRLSPWKMLCRRTYRVFNCEVPLYSSAQERPSKDKLNRFKAPAQLL